MARFSSCKRTQPLPGDRDPRARTVTARQPAATPEERPRGVRPTAEGGPAVQLRGATLADIEPLQALLATLDRRHVELHPGFFQLRPRALAYLHGLIIDDDCTLVVAELRGQLVGAVSARLYDTPADPMMTPRRRAYADDLVVVAEQRRQGIGRLLMGEVSRWARREGAEQVVLTIWVGNEEAERLYEALGYHAINRVLAIDVDT